jgi:hypothetical protein
VAVLQHEIWIDRDEDGNALESCVLAGPSGDDARKLLSPNARLAHVFEASSHFEAMTIYYRLLKRGAYTTDQEWDHEPYPDAWLEIQQSAPRH